MSTFCKNFFDFFSKGIECLDFEAALPPEPENNDLINKKNKIKLRKDRVETIELFFTSLIF